MKNNKILKAALKLLLVVGIIAVIAVTAFLILRACGYTSVEKWVELREELGDSVSFWIIIGAFQVFQVIFIPISNQIITVPLALIFSKSELWKVWITSFLSIWVATLILYFIGRFGGGKLMNWILGDKEETEKCKKFLNKGWMFYPIGMLLPLPDDVVTVLAGTAKMNFLFIMICSFFTRAIDVACSVFGFGLLAKHWWGWVILGGGILLLCVFTVILFLIEKNKQVKEN